MIRTLVAEDELPLLRGIRQMIERENPEFKVVCCAKNGKEALEYLSQHDVDVVFTDINMPVLDGLALLEFLHKKNPDIQCVVISGYDEFDYARRSMQFGVRSYLLKPIDHNELAQLLVQLRQDIVRRSYTQKREALIECLFGHTAAAVEACRWGALSMLYLCVGAYQSVQTAEELSRPGGLSSSELSEAVRKAVKGKGEAWLFFGQHPNEAIWIFEDAPQMALPEIAALVHKSLCCVLPVTVATGRAALAPRELREEAARLAQRLRDGLVFGESRVLRSDSATRPFHMDAADSGTLLVAAQKKQYDEFALVILRLAQRMRERQATQRELEGLLEAVLTLLSRELAGEGARDAQSAAQELVSGSDCYQTLFEALLSYCEDLFRNRPFDTGDKEGLMQALDAYILDNIASPLSLRELGARFGLVAPYLSRLFKAYKGVSPAQYVQNIRIESAKRMLLENPTMLSKDIAQALGYSNALYFSKTFYKNVGIYPSEYRQQAKAVPKTTK